MTHGQEALWSTKAAHAATCDRGSECEPRGAVIIDAGHTAQRLSPDCGYDLVLFTYDEQGFVELDSVFLQIKAALFCRFFQTRHA